MPTESTASCNAVKILTHEEFAAKHPHPPSPDKVRIDRHANSKVDRYSEANTDRQPSPPIDRRAPITYRVQMSKIDVTRLNALRPKPKPSEQPPEPIRTPSDDGDDPMEEDRVSTRRTLRRRKEKVAKHLKRGANEKEKENFQKRVFKIPLHKPFEEAYYSHRLIDRDSHSNTVDSSHQKSTDIPHDESVDSSPDDWENDYYNPTIDAYTRQNMHTDEYDEDFEEERAIDLPSIDTQPQQRSRDRASTDTAAYPSIDTDLNRVRDGDYSIGSWADEHHHESFAVETVTYTTGADKLQDSFTDEELLNMQKRDDTYQFQAEAAWERTHSSQSIDTRHQQSINTRPQQSIDTNNTTSIDNRSIPKTTLSEKKKLDNQYLTPHEFGIFRDPNGFAKAIDGRTLHVSREDIADILQTADGADNMFMHQRSNREQKTTKEFYDTAGGIENNFKQRFCHTTHPSINTDVPTVARQPEFGKRAYDFYGNRKFYWEENDEYGVYRDDCEFARDLDGHTILVHTKDIRRLLEKASRDEPAYICLPEHASSFTQTQLVPELYTKDEINEMFYGVCGEYERDEEGHSQIQNATDVARPPSIDSSQSPSIDSSQSPSIDRHHHTSIDNRLAASIDINLPRPHTMKSQPDSHTREVIDQLVEGIYRALETTEERLDGRCDDIYFPMDLTISALTSKVEAIQGELVEIQSYIAH
ncbi:hypothetical protein DY000_02005963 [Brassica cretica]|uniref:Uncharacterized protein n=1 Tax=Brassica cretica TaxID=69181 RepID=A0ABQ7C0T7_BRACR|nr:hypothetical protein DY000_02005963 [Brassica cretica]